MQKTAAVVSVLIALVCVLIFAREINATLTSNVDAGSGHHIAIPNKEMVVTCSVSGDSLLDWVVKPFFTEPAGRFAQGDEVGSDPKIQGRFSMNLTNKNQFSDNNTIKYNYSSTLTFNVSASDSQLQITCNDQSIGPLYLTYTLNLSLALNGQTGRTHTLHRNSMAELMCTAFNATELIWEVVYPDGTSTTIKKLNSSSTVGHRGHSYYNAKIIAASEESTTSTLNFVANATTNGSIIKCGDGNYFIATIITVDNSTVPTLTQAQNLSCVFEEADCAALDMIVRCDWAQPDTGNTTAYNITTTSGDYADEIPGHVRTAELKTSCNGTAANESVSLVAVTSLGISSTATSLAAAVGRCLEECSLASAKDSPSSPAGPIAGAITAVLVLLAGAAALILTLYLLTTRREEILTKINLGGPSKPTKLRPVIIALTEARVQWAMGCLSPQVEAFTVHVETYKPGEDNREAAGVMDAIGALDGVRRDVVLRHLVPNQTWQVRVTAWRDGVGAESKPLLFVTPPAPPKKPDIVDVCRKEGQCQAILTWRMAPDNENRLPSMYHIVTRCLDQEAAGTLGNEGDPFAEPQVIAGDKCEATIKQILPHARYFIRVISINGDGQSACSETEL